MKTKNSGLSGQGFAHPENSMGAMTNKDFANKDFANIVPVVPGQIGVRETGVVSAKALHIALGVGNDFSTWAKLRIDEFGFVMGTDYAVFDSSDFRNQSTNIDLHSENWKTKRGGDRRSKDYLLSLGMAKELAMVERNEQGRAVRRYFIKCEEALHLSAPEVAASFRKQLKARITAASYFKPMCEALEAARTEHGKKTLPRHYSNESNMIARIVLGGLTAKQWAQANGIDGEPRDGMSGDQLEHFAYLEQTNITLIELGKDYGERKAELIRLSQRRLAKNLVA
ncbi:antA/AntB antirepressor family protein [Salmonella enterica]|nr:antA/AntB antirepressor family protein [Salmonella enterica]HCM1893421.1 antA/AntB antirepressor family protein [Salmonella enterica subsp. diarizonae serovar 57:c:e,n,x,z15]EGQ5164893.1 antA/AntB antirepressor family protein [Salmonella enterica]EKA4657689.1 antA/AntB antirepressor family protein [Salmonella enterica]EKF8523539.1 antA/AntB antirepressor family protein [Salmonella enterica]